MTEMNINSKKHSKDSTYIIGENMNTTKPQDHERIYEYESEGDDTRNDYEYVREDIDDPMHDDISSNDADYEDIDYIERENLIDARTDEHNYVLDDDDLKVVNVSSDDEPNDPINPTDSIDPLDFMGYSSARDIKTDHIIDLETDKATDKKKLNIENLDSIAFDSKINHTTLRPSTGSSMLIGSINNNNTSSIIIGEKSDTERHISRIVSDFISKKSDTLVIKNLHLIEIPVIISTLHQVKKLIITNCALTTLKNLPPNLEFLDARFNDLTTIISSDLPETLIEMTVAKNCLKTIDLYGSTRMKLLNIANNPITNVIAFPPNLIELYAMSCDLDNTNAISKLNHLSILKINMTQITSLDDIPDNVTDLTASRINLRNDKDKKGKQTGIINKLPHNIVTFVCGVAGISGFGFKEFPQSLKKLDVYSNEITYLPKLPDTISHVDITKNAVEKIENIPKRIKSFDCCDNPKLVFTTEQLKIIEELKKDPDINFSADTLYPQDDGSQFWNSTSDRVGYEDAQSFWNSTKYVKRGDDSIVIGSYRDKKTDQGTILTTTEPSTTTSTTLSQSQIPSRAAGPIMIYNQRMMQQGPERNPTVSRPGGFGHFGPRSTLGARFGERLFPQRPQYPPHILKLMESDGFFPTRSRDRLVKHKYSYAV